MVTPVTEVNAYEVIEQLGVKPSFSFEAEAIIFVEDPDDIVVYETWAKKFGFKIKVQFLDAEQASTLHYFANARIALSKFVHTLVFAVFGSEAAPEETLQARGRIIQHLELPRNQIIVLEFSELEAYLMEPKAILKAFPSIPLSPDDLERRLAPFRSQPGQKKALRDLLVEFRIGEYDGRLGARIADALDDIPNPVAQLFDQIETASKPFWRI